MTDDGLARTLAALRQVQEESDPSVLVRTPEIVVSATTQLSEGEWKRLQDALAGEASDRWLVGVDIHVAVKQPNGTWVRVCHAHPIQAPVPRSSELKAVWLSDELFRQMGLAVEWGEADPETGFYEPRVTRQLF